MGVGVDVGVGVVWVWVWVWSVVSFDCGATLHIVAICMIVNTPLPSFTRRHTRNRRRCIDTGRSLPRDEADRFLLRAEPLRAALDPASFFLMQILRKCSGK